MNKKVLVLVLMMIFTSLIPSFSYGEKQYDLKLKEAIVKSKKLFEITSEYDKFNSNISEYDGSTVFNLIWEDSKEKLGSIIITTDIDGNIISYDNYVNDYNRPENKLPKYSKEESQKVAMDFINKVSPDIKSIKLSKSDNIDDLNDEFYNFNYTRYVNDIKYRDDTIDINVNKYTGEVLNYYVTWERYIEFPSTDKAIELEKAKKIFQDKIGLKLVYKTQRQEYSPISIGESNVKYNLVYSVIEPNVGIDAIDGEKINVDYYGPYESDSSMGKEDSVENELSPEEEASVDQVKNILNEKQAEEGAKEIMNIGNSYKLQDQNLYKNYKNPKEYIWNMYFVSEKAKDKPDINIGIDAKTGDLLNFYKEENYSEKDKNKVSEKKALKLAKDYINKQIPDEKEKIELINDMNIYLESDGQPMTYNFSFMRKEDNIYVEDDNVYIGVSSVDGDIISYSIDWYGGKFPPKSNIIPIERAYDILWKEIGLDLMYVKVPDDKISSKSSNIESNTVKLVYLLNPDKPSIIDVDNGDILDYSGRKYKERELLGYNDIEDSYAVDKIKTLAEYGIGLSGEEFLPKNKITQSDYMYFLWKSIEQDRSEEADLEELYDYFIRSEYMLENERAEERIVKKEEAVKYIIRIMNLEEVAKVDKIYKDIFKDQNEIEEGLKGYINIAYGLNIIKEDETGNINPKFELRREDAADIIYNYIFR